ncbi:hypothetical protein [Weissella cibaria]|uniref:hypothetical protein n=1 Tax=Weissella cibaria TaxID=137591 RepID=UPI00223B0E06|nr:hypothetical protein [Weissella cibaria]
MKAEGEYFKSVLFMLVILAGIYVYFRFCTNDYQGVVVWFNDHYTVKYFFPFVTAYFVIMNFAYNKEKDKQKILSDQVMSNLNILNGRVQSEGVIEKPEKILKDIKYELDNRPEKEKIFRQVYYQAIYFVLSSPKKSYRKQFSNLVGNQISEESENRNFWMKLAKYIQTHRYKHEYDAELPDYLVRDFVDMFREIRESNDTGVDLNLKKFLIELMNSDDVRKAQKQRWIRYKVQKRIVDEYFMTNVELGDLFRLVHRVVKLVNYMNVPVYEQKEYYAQLRAIMPDELLLVLYYNATYTERGQGLSLQLVGTRFFGDEEDLTTGRGQHIQLSDLLFGKMDISIMNNLYAGDFFPALNSNESPEKVLFLKQKEEQKQTKSLFRQ